ncbi:uncharacterized protein UBRO_20176 [Ustilago bromivora]|uniref:Uncharacterized protein n=1 Tax=Ustilago bromivora TaxID=307758 RepID=A0A1K0GCP3_9BASI|nr:uncharacterized protein UBRO_20176 [Ustilago bromivora]SYW85366.1 uncharacterized protein UBRO2_05805 [Ustilago bromivora]
MSCSPPSSPPPGPRIKSISNMPAEEQQWYYCLAIEEGSSSSSSPGNMGVTSQGEDSKTWQTTWDNSNQPSTSTVSLAATSRLNLASGSSSSSGVAKGSPSSTSSAAIRGQEPSTSTVDKALCCQLLAQSLAIIAVEVNTLLREVQGNNGEEFIELYRSATQEYFQH